TQADGSLTIGNGTNGAGMWQITAGKLTINPTKGLYVGVTETGSLDISDTTIVEASNSDVFIGAGSGGLGLVTQTGGTFIHSGTGGFRFASGTGSIGSY